MPKLIEDEQIYRAVMQTIMERGYAGATTKQMAEAASVSEVTLFRKYASKAQLVKRAIAALIEQSDFTAATEYSGDLPADLLRVLTAYKASVIVQGGFFAVLFSEISRNPELAESFAEPLNLFRAIGQLLARYQAEGCLQPEPPLQAVAALLGPLIYAEAMRNAMPANQLPPLDLQTHVRRYLEGRSSQLSGSVKPD
jgi:AcrR family transcriptional regulator